MNAWKGYTKILHQHISDYLLSVTNGTISNNLENKKNPFIRNGHKLDGPSIIPKNNCQISVPINNDPG